MRELMVIHVMNGHDIRGHKISEQHILRWKDQMMQSNLGQEA